MKTDNMVLLGAPILIFKISFDYTSFKLSDFELIWYALLHNRKFHNQVHYYFYFISILLIVSINAHNKICSAYYEPFTKNVFALYFDYFCMESTKRTRFCKSNDRPYAYDILYNNWIFPYKINGWLVAFLRKQWLRQSAVVNLCLNVSLLCSSGYIFYYTFYGVF